MNPCLAIESSGNCIQCSCLFQIKNSGGKVDPDTLLLLAGINPPQEEDGPVNAAFPELDPLGKKSHTECRNPKRFELLRDIHETVPVSVGLDDFQNAAIRAYRLQYPGVVVAKCRKIYLCKCRPAVGHMKLLNLLSAF